MTRLNAKQVFLLSLRWVYNPRRLAKLLGYFDASIPTLHATLGVRKNTIESESSVSCEKWASKAWFQNLARRFRSKDIESIRTLLQNFEIVRPDQVGCLHSDAARILLPGGRDGLVQSLRDLLAIVEQHGGRFLYGGFGERSNTRRSISRNTSPEPIVIEGLAST